MKRLGIDVGGTSIKVVVLEDKGIKSSFFRTPKNAAGFKKLLNQIIGEFGPKFEHIGIGIPGVVDYEKMRVLNAVNLKFLKNFSSKDIKVGKAQVKLENDAKCRFNSELHYGLAAEVKNAVMISIGTGIGCAISINRKIYYGQGSAGELGHMIIHNNKEFEELAGGKSLKRFNSREFKRIGHYLSYAFANVINILNPEIIILAGGVIESHYSQIKPHIGKEFLKHVVSPQAKKTKIVKSQLSEFAGAIGAALL